MSILICMCVPLPTKFVGDDAARGWRGSVC